MEVIEIVKSLRWLSEELRDEKRGMEAKICRVAADRLVGLDDRCTESEKEIERLKHILNCYVLQYGTVTDQQRVIGEAKTEVAREIFAEIEKTVEDAEFEWGTICGVKLCIAELKKKYTEEKNDG